MDAIFLVAEEYFDQTVFRGVGSYRDGLAMKCFAYGECVASVMNIAAMLNLAHVARVGVLDCWQRLRERPGTAQLTRGGGVHSQSLMRTLVVIAVAPGIKAGLCLRQVLERLALKDFELQ